jgi:hypothetical protein
MFGTFFGISSTPMQPVTCNDVMNFYVRYWMKKKIKVTIVGLKPNQKDTVIKIFFFVYINRRFQNKQVNWF